MTTDMMDLYNQSSETASAFHYAVAKLQAKYDYFSGYNHVLQAGAVALYLLHGDNKNVDFNKIDSHLYKYRLDKPARRGADVYDRHPYLDCVKEMFEYLCDDSVYHAEVLAEITEEGENGLQWKTQVPSKPREFIDLLHPYDVFQDHTKHFEQVISAYLDHDGTIDGNPNFSAMYHAIYDVMGADKGEDNAFQYLALIAYAMKDKKHELTGVTMQQVSDVVTEWQNDNNRMQAIREVDKPVRRALKYISAGMILLLAYNECSGDIAEEQDNSAIEQVQPQAEIDPQVEAKQNSAIYTMPNGQQVIKP